MNSQPYSSAEQVRAGKYDTWHFYTETIEVPSMSSFAFYGAGSVYMGQRMFWQNRESTFTFVGLGHAHVLISETEDRYEKIKRDWQDLCRQIVNEEPAVQPVLFGGFSFDPENDTGGKWRDFRPAYFAVPTFQLIIKEDQAYVSIHLITQETDAFEAFDQLRKERDELIHAAQVSEPANTDKITVIRRTELEKEQYLQSIKELTEAIRAGEADKVVIARQLKLDFESPVDHADLLQQVAGQQQGSFLFGVEAGSQLFFGATPERLVRVVEREALSTCLAGSIPRGKNAEEDAMLGRKLMDDHKNRSEHAYVVNMISSVFHAHCTSAVIPTVPELMKIRDIQHLYTPVKGKLQSESTLFDLVRELHPTPALGGEPREKALQLIRQYEPTDRGYYAAPIGWVDSEGNGEFAVAIRSALLDGNKAYLYAGGGIVADSTSELEYAETWMKFRPMLRALGGQIRDES